MAIVYIFSEPAASGKTTALENWLVKTDGAAGFLTPDIYGKRKLYDVVSGDYFDFEVDPGSVDDSIALGDRFYDNNIYRYGQQLLQDGMKDWPRWLIVDEITELEIDQGKGWEPVLQQLIEEHYNTDNDCDLMLVVRDTLLEKLIQHYRLHAAIVLDRKFFGK